MAEHKKFKSAPSAEHNEMEDSSTVETLTISSAYPSKNEGRNWREKHRNNVNVISDIELKEIHSPQNENKDITIQYNMKLSRLTTLVDQYTLYCHDKHNIIDFIDTIDINNTIVDYLYLLHEHSNEKQMQLFRNELGRCDLFNCIIFKRNFRIGCCYSDTESLIDSYATDNFTTIAYLDILDTIHCYCQHNYLLNPSQKPTLSIDNNKSNEIDMYRVINRRHMKYTELTLQTTVDNIYCFGCEFQYDGTDEEEKSDVVIIIPKFSSFKQELLSMKKNIPNSFISKSEFETEYKKADIYFNSMYRKEYYPLISINNLLALMIYCFDILKKGA